MLPRGGVRRWLNVSFDAFPFVFSSSLFHGVSLARSTHSLISLELVSSGQGMSKGDHYLKASLLSKCSSSHASIATIILSGYLEKASSICLLSNKCSVAEKQLSRRRSQGIQQRRLRIEGLVHKLLKLLVCLFKVVVYEHLVVNARGLGILELVLCLLKALLDALFLFGSSSTQSRLERLQAWRRDEDVTCVNGRLLDLLDTLHLNIEKHDLALLALLLNGRLASTIAVASKFCVLDEAILGNQVLEALCGHEVVVDSIGLAGTGGPGGVGDGEGEDVGMFSAQAVVKCAFANSRGAGDDDRATVGRSWWGESAGGILRGSEHGAIQGQFRSEIRS